MNNIDSLVDTNYRLLTRGAVSKNRELKTGGVFTPEEIRKKLELSLYKNKPLNIYAGFDPTNDSLTIAHLAVVKKLKIAASMGHNVTFLTGSATVLTGGDPTDKLSTRERISEKQVFNNALKIQNQMKSILGNSVNIQDNYFSWFKDMDWLDFVKYIRDDISLNRLEQAAYIKGREKRGTPVYPLEALYPLIMGIDSYNLRADIQFGGLDQLFNLGICREYQEKRGQVPQSMISLKMLGFKPGKKISKSDPETYFPVSSPVGAIYGGIMNMAHQVLPVWLELFTDIDYRDINNIENIIKRLDGPAPKEISNLKELVAKEILGLIYPNDKYVFEKAREQFSSGELIYRLDQSHIKGITFIDLAYEIINSNPDLVKKYSRAGSLEVSKNELKKLFSQKGIKFDNIPIENPYALITDFPSELNLGKKYTINIEYN